MFNLNYFKQKSPQQRFLFILGLTMLLIYLGIGTVVIFFSQLLPIDPEKFPRPYQVAFGVVLIIYAAIRFGRIINQKDHE
ncbi:hypothetical protein [Pedobacter sp. Hv1]|uniref:hypothetical protein n=1 Tax=Pedobacter sp. Hv1 TaxID=1740090 RepID=UPI0006D89989|nr:hypothetical protein [Pedobacter sp. Hv1]KQC01434.1 hypothetical protein AQF98_06925 [Pedobacter sp. Hv1]